jgi:hypothetical protein
VKPRRETDKQTDNRTRQNSNGKSSLLQNKPKIHKLANVAMSSHRDGERERGKKKSITKKLLQKPRTTEKKERKKKQTNKQQRVEAANNNKF